MTARDNKPPRPDDYAPYHNMVAFGLGYNDYFDNKPVRELPGVDGQAYDRGAELAMRTKAYLRNNR